jgi:predicted flap endonuclease-1-like 5' DNA nuclease
MSRRRTPLPLDKLSAPARRALAGAGFTSLQQLAKVKEADIARLHGIGPNALSVLKKELAANHLAFAKA